jgi:head-tail adaptor
MLEAGKLDRRIIIQTPLPRTKKNSGAEEDAWTTFKDNVPAQVIPISASERFTSDGLHSVKVNRFRIRYLPGILPIFRLSYDGSYWRISGIAEIGRREGLDILAESID